MFIGFVYSALLLTSDYLNENNIARYAGLLFNPAETLQKGLFALQENKVGYFLKTVYLIFLVLGCNHGKPSKKNIYFKKIRKKEKYDKPKIIEMKKK